MYFHFHPVLFLNFVSGTFVIASNDVEPDAFEFDFSRNTGSLIVASNITKCHCKKFELTSHGRSLGWQNSKLGKYDHVPFLVNTKDLFYNFHQKQYLFWAEDKPGYWMFGPNPTENSGGIVNRGCPDVACPVDGSCKGHWLYTNGSNWEADSSINLKCIEFVDIFDDKTASLRNKPGGGNTRPGGGKNPGDKQTGPDGKRAPRCDVKAKSSNTKPRSGTRDSLPSRRQRKGPRGGRRTRNKYPNTCSCFKKRDCKSRKCSRCPNALRCGNPINKRCKLDSDCCSGKCVRNKCSNCDCLGSKCKRNTQCCSGNCVKRVCQSSDNCLPKMKRCDQPNPTRKPKGTKPNNRRPTPRPSRPEKETNSTRTCCEGLVCINRKCQEQSLNCTEDGGPCTKKADCCNKFCDKQGNKKGPKGSKRDSKGVCREKSVACKNSGRCRNETQCCSKTCTVRGQCKPQEKDCIPKHHGVGSETGTDNEENDRIKCSTGGGRERKCCAPYECEAGKCVSPKCKQENRDCQPNSQDEADKCCGNLKCVKHGRHHKCEDPSAPTCLRKNVPCTPNSAQKCCRGCSCQRHKKGRSYDGTKKEKAVTDAYPIFGTNEALNPDNRAKKCIVVRCNKLECRNHPKCRTAKPNKTTKPTKTTKKSTTKDPGRTTKSPGKTTKDDGKTKTTRRDTKTTRGGLTDKPGRTTQKPTGEFICKGRGRCRGN